ncbi:Cna B-type domain-containing protein [Granulicatella sp. 19428wC4_WM01]|nr:Cna B-type domain-containing protein [Granulicatella sp. 19428wC4_WM01]TFU95487.1 Cna B-type domain-containing protein [Granulicatella sp. WM01]
MLICTVKEISKITGYASVIGSVECGKVTIVNTHLSEITRISGQKSWHDEQNKVVVRPEKIPVCLYVNGIEMVFLDVNKATY